MVQCKFCKKQMLYFNNMYVCKNCGSALVLKNKLRTKILFDHEGNIIDGIDYSLVWKEKYIKVVK